MSKYTPLEIADIRADYASLIATFKAGIEKAKLSARMQVLRRESPESIEQAVQHACDLSYEVGRLQATSEAFEMSLPQSTNYPR